jgi:plasmid stabilization system protein ParE
MKVTLLPRAAADLEENVDFLESQSAGYGAYFSKCLFEELRRLRRHAGMHAKQSGYHMMIMKRFSHAIFYKVEGNIAWVAAIIDCRRDPDWIAERLS